MILDWINFIAGDTGLAIRNDINTFNTNVKTQVNQNTTDIATNKTDVTGLKNPEWTDYNPQTTLPPWEEGRIFYTGDCQDVCTYTDILDLPISLVQMSTMRVYNDTGSTIVNGKVCTYDGAYEGNPKIKLAIADSIRNATVIGMTMHDIPNGTEGFIITHGKLREQNTSGRTLGVPLYLSDTIPGELVETPPDIVTRVCGAISINGTEGKYYVNIQSNIAPTVSVGYLSGAAANTYNLTSTPVNITGYVDEDSVLMTSNKVSGTINVFSSGIFKATFTGSLTFSSSADTRTLGLELYNVTTATVLDTFYSNIPKNATENGISFTLPFSAVDGNELVIRIKSDPNMSISFNSMAFDVVSLHAR